MAFGLGDEGQKSTWQGLKATHRVPGKLQTWEEEDGVRKGQLSYLLRGEGAPQRPLSPSRLGGAAAKGEIQGTMAAPTAPGALKTQEGTLSYVTGGHSHRARSMPG